MNKPKSDAAADFSQMSADFLSRIAEMQKAVGMFPMAPGAGAFGAATQDYMQEVSRFMTLRFEKDIKAQQAFLGCTSLDDLRDVHMRFVEEAMDDYRQEAERLAKIGQRFLDVGGSGEDTDS